MRSMSLPCSHKSQLTLGVTSTSYERGAPRITDCTEGHGSSHDARRPSSLLVDITATAFTPPNAPSFHSVLRPLSTVPLISSHVSTPLPILRYPPLPCHALRHLDLCDQREENSWGRRGRRCHSRVRKVGGPGPTSDPPAPESPTRQLKAPESSSIKERTTSGRTSSSCCRRPRGQAQHEETHPEPAILAVFETEHDENIRAMGKRGQKNGSESPKE